MIKQLTTEMRQMMDKTLDMIRREIGQVRTGRASAALIEDLAVGYYGTPTPLRQLATITVSNPRLLIVQPWDASAVAEIEKAILRSGIGLNPAAEGHAIKVPIPALSEERRRELVRVVHKMAEEGRVTVRNERRKARETLKAAEKEGKISEDESRKAQDELQKLTDDHILEVDRLVAAKEKEIMEI